MKPWIRYILIGLVLAGCGGSSSDAPLYTYPDEFKASFMASCERASGNRDRCRCALDELQDRVPTAEIVRSSAGTTSSDVRDAMAAAIAKCS